MLLHTTVTYPVTADQTLIDEDRIEVGNTLLGVLSLVQVLRAAH